ncbi:hypothetical protein K0M31_001122 [Melipona bicolor]|uniref:Uncharacterized protein n=1 Tax=Melipona bicolor TaxID=60889 RepID=A0AA40GEW9_9HYME|nr:hypothetical protein K0M31_001122 [Melipona bicolor]
MKNMIVQREQIRMVGDTVVKFQMTQHSAFRHIKSILEVAPAGAWPDSVHELQNRLTMNTVNVNAHVILHRKPCTATGNPETRGTKVAPECRGLMDTYGRHPYGNHPSALQPNSASGAGLVIAL